MCLRAGRTSPAFLDSYDLQPFTKAHSRRNSQPILSHSQPAIWHVLLRCQGMSAYLEHLYLFYLYCLFKSSCSIYTKKKPTVPNTPIATTAWSYRNPNSYCKRHDATQTSPYVLSCPKNPCLAAEDPLSKWKENGILKYDFVRSVCMLDSILFSSAYSWVCTNGITLCSLLGPDFWLPIPFPDLPLV